MEAAISSTASTPTASASTNKKTRKRPLTLAVRTVDLSSMDASYAFSRSLALLTSYVLSDFFAKLLSKSNNLCGSGSGRIFALPLPQKKDRFHRFRFHNPGFNICFQKKRCLQQAYTTPLLQNTLLYFKLKLWGLQTRLTDENFKKKQAVLKRPGGGQTVYAQPEKSQTTLFAVLL